MTLTLGFRLNHRDYLGTGIHQFCLGNHTSSARNLLKDRVNKHQFIAGGGGSPTLTNTSYLIAPDGVTLLKTLTMARSAHACLQVVMDTLLGRYHPSAQAMYMVFQTLMDR